MKALYVLGCLLSYRHYASYIETVFVKHEMRSTVASSQPSCGAISDNAAEHSARPIFAKEEFYLIVYNNLVVTLMLALVLVYGAILSDRLKALYAGESEENYLSMLVSSPLFGSKYESSQVLGKLLIAVLVHYAVVFVYLSVSNSALRTRSQVRTEALFVYALSMVFTVMLL
jgi:hypothetical protein